MEFRVEYNSEGWWDFQEFKSIYPVFIAKLRVTGSTYLISIWNNNKQFNANKIK